MIAQEERCHTIARPSAFDIDPDLTASTDPVAWVAAMADSKVLTGKEKSLIWPLACFAGETTGRVDCCDAGYEETAFKLGVPVARVRAAWKHAVDAGFIVELPDGCLQLMIPAGSDTSRI